MVGSNQINREMLHVSVLLMQEYMYQISLIAIWKHAVLEFSPYLLRDPYVFRDYPHKFE